MRSWIERGLVFSSAVMLAASFAGEVHGLGDCLAVFRPLILIGCLVVSGLAGRWRGAQIVALMACLGTLWRGVAVLSHTPLLQENCAHAPGMAWAVTEVRGTLVQVISLHLHWPWPYSQQGHAAVLVEEISQLKDGMTVIGGDFNMAASGQTLAWFEQATGTARVGPLVRTFDLFDYPLGIDHVLATGGTGGCRSGRSWGQITLAYWRRPCFPSEPGSIRNSVCEA